MNPWRWVDPRIQSIRLADIKGYFQQKGWQLKPDPNPELLRFEKPARGKGRPFFQVFPASDQFDTFPQRLAELITTLSELENCHPVEILNDMLACDPEPKDNGAAKSKRTKPVRN